MRPLPTHIKNEIWEEDHLELEWWGRRPFYEIIEPLSDAFANAWIVGSSFLAGSQVFGLGGRIYWGGCAVIVSIVLSKAYYDFRNWYDECHVVMSDTSKAGEGRYYKFQGWLNKNEEPVVIKGASPSPKLEEPIPYKIWNWITGDDMILLTIDVPTKDAAVLYRVRSHRALKRAIDRVWNSKKDDKVGMEGDISVKLNDALIIEKLLRRGVVDDYYAREKIQYLIEEVVR